MNTSLIVLDNNNTTVVDDLTIHFHMGFVELYQDSLTLDNLENYCVYVWQIRCLLIKYKANAPTSGLSYTCSPQCLLKYFLINPKTFCTHSSVFEHIFITIVMYMSTVLLCVSAICSAKMDSSNLLN